jgi:Ca-activated chloride channel homolog
MTFAYPYLLLLILALPLLAWWRNRRERPAAFLYSSVQLVRGITGVRQSHAGMILRRMRWLTILLFIVGLARPQWGESESRVTSSGIDIVVAIDLSGSMSAEDFTLRNQRVNRLVIAKDVLHQFINSRPNDRIGLVAFARHASIAAPLTLDHAYLRDVVDRLEIATPDEDGTAIGSALMASLNRLRDLPAASKIVILMTDGQNNSGRVPPLTAAEVAETLGVRTYTIGVGTRGTALMPVVDRFGTRRYVQQQVDIDEETLQIIADRTGGRYYRADSTEIFRSIYAEIDQLETTEIEVQQYYHYRELFPWLLLPGLFLLLLEIILGNTVWRRLP